MTFKNIMLCFLEENEAIQLQLQIAEATITKFNKLKKIFIDRGIATKEL